MPKKWIEMCKDLGFSHPEMTGVDDVLSKVLETDMVANIDVPVKVYIDPEMNYSVLVYDN